MQVFGTVFRTHRRPQSNLKIVNIYGVCVVCISNLNIRSKTLPKCNTHTKIPASKIQQPPKKLALWKCFWFACGIKNAKDTNCVKLSISRFGRSREGQMAARHNSLSCRAPLGLPRFNKDLNLCASWCGVFRMCLHYWSSELIILKYCATILK